MPKRQSKEELEQTQGFDIEYTVPFMGMLSQDPVARMGWDPSKHVYTPAFGEGTPYGMSIHNTIPANYNDDPQRPYIAAAREYIMKYRPDLMGALDVISLRPGIATGEEASYVPVHEARHIGLGQIIDKGMMGGLTRNREEAFMRAKDLEIAPDEWYNFAETAMGDEDTLGPYATYYTPRKLLKLYREYEEKAPEFGGLSF